MEQTLRPYNPTWRDQLAQWVLGDQRPTAGQRSFVSGLLGSAGTGSTGASVADMTPIGGLLSAQENAQRGDMKGAALAMLPMPAGAMRRPLDAALDALGPKDLERALMKAREIIPNNHPKVMWHGSGSGDIRGGASGLHLGTHEAARQALEARIGVPAEGLWTGTRAYGDTMLMGKDRIPQRADGEKYVSGYNVDAPAQDYLPTIMPHVSHNVYMDPSWTPSILPYRITGEMKNTPHTPMSDMKANATMQGLLKRGMARRGLYYGNVAEDAGSISATVPGPSHVEPIDLETLLRTGKYGLVGLLGGGAALGASGQPQPEL